MARSDLSETQDWSDIRKLTEGVPHTNKEQKRTSISVKKKKKALDNT